MFHNEPLNILPVKFNPVPIAAAKPSKYYGRVRGDAVGLNEIFQSSAVALYLLT